MLTADTKLDIRSGTSALLGCHLNKLSYPLLVQSCKRIRFIDLVLIIITKELAGIISGEAKGHLCQVIGSKGEELCLLCNFIGKECSSWDLDHSTDVILDIGILLFLHSLCGLYHNILDKFQFLPVSY